MKKIIIISLVTVLFLFSSCGVDESKNSCNYEDENRFYVAKIDYDCSRVGYGCDYPNRVKFRDECGCGCEIIS
jgi:hypothetical protein